MFDAVVTGNVVLAAIRPGPDLDVWHNVVRHGAPVPDDLTLDLDVTRPSPDPPAPQQRPRLTQPGAR